jgi:hypothetical protein
VLLALAQGRFGDVVSYHGDPVNGQRSTADEVAAVAGPIFLTSAVNRVAWAQLTQCAVRCRDQIMEISKRPTKNN